MHIPVETRARGQRRVNFRKENFGENRGDDGADDMVEERGKQELVDMQGECGEGERVRNGRDEFDKPGRRGKGEEAVHGEGWRAGSGGGAQRRSVVAALSLSLSRHHGG